MSNEPTRSPWALGPSTMPAIYACKSETEDRVLEEALYQEKSRMKIDGGVIGRFFNDPGLASNVSRGAHDVQVKDERSHRTSEAVAERSMSASVFQENHRTNRMNQVDF